MFHHMFNETLRALFGLAKDSESVVQVLMVVISLYKKTGGVVINGDDLCKFIKEYG